MDLSSVKDFQPLSILAYEWEFYPQELIAPGEFDGSEPNFIFLGQYGGFENGSLANSPHGCATYRLQILLPQEAAEYALELPEIYTASRIWVDSRLVSNLGDVSDKGAEPAVRTGIVTFQAAGSTEIVVQASDYSHYYSGMVYPPAFGTPKAVSDLISFRLLRTCIMVISSFTIGIMYLLIGLRTGEERHRMILFALTSLLFSLHVMYPLFHLLGAGYWTYRFEDVSFYLFLLMIAALHCSLCKIGGRWRQIVLGFGAAAALLSFMVPSLLTGSGVTRMLIYSAFIDSYKLVFFSWLIITALLNREHGEAMNGPLLAGLCILAVSLLFQAVAPVFEPVRFGWQTENAGFVFILLLGGGLWFDTVSAYAGRAALTENMRLMKKQFLLQEENYRIISDNFEEIRQMRHDLRHHLYTIMELSNQHQYDELERYIKGCEESTEQAVRPTLCENHAANAVLNYYLQLAFQKDVPVDLKVSLPSDLKLEGWNLGVLFGNLLENAIDASEKLPKEWRTVKVYSKISKGNLLLTVKNSWNGEFSISGDQIYSTKHEGKGTGLSSVRSLVEKTGGQFYLNPDKEEFEVSIVLWNQI
ncbi:GHKL domain-containing protein [Clostridium sp. AM58-1XD]|uniref:sensor histidine kinase n=1 Tax=Clostridium sp. AM58-1XD TaxID=2292307 RepID=UPI001FA87C55|nr:GHKL domain-containing protein [Clostridium sp. AM58-1XD]